MDNQEPASEESSPEMFDPRPVQNARAYQIFSYSDTGHDLTVEEQLFCSSYIIDRNEVAAMRRIGYDDVPAATLKSRALKMMTNPEVQGCIEVLAKRTMDALQITAERVNEAVASIAFFDFRNVAEFDHSGIKFKHSKFWTKHEAAAITGLKVTKDGVELKFGDRQRAQEYLGKQLGMASDESDMTKAMAQGMAEAAINKIMEVTGRMRPKPVEIEAPVEEPFDEKPTVQ